MNDLAFLQSLFNGYCNCYSVHNWHTEATYTDMTHNELQYFVQLGNMLGFLSRREFERMDLSWHECAPTGNGRLVLYLERENHNDKALNDTLDKLLISTQSNEAEYLVGVFGWMTRATHDMAAQEIAKDIGNRNLLTIAFIGVDCDHATEVQGIVWHQGKRYYRSAKAKTDRGGYWYIYFEDGSTWDELLIEVSC